MSCTGCGRCCSNLLPLTSREIKTIRRYIKKKGIEAIPSLNEMDCPFCDYTKQNKCLIYDVRPEICRAFYCNGEMKASLLGLRRMKPIVMRDTFYGNCNR